MTLTDEQKKLRRTGIGASEVSAVLGLPAFLSPLDVWLAKVEGVEQEETADLRRGRVLEDAVAQLYAEETGATLLPGVTMRHPSQHVLIATPDRMVADPGGNFPLEVKTARGSQRHLFGEPGTDEVPQQYLLQVAAQMAVTGASRAELAVLLAGDDLRVYRFDRDRELEQAILRGVVAWWEAYVVTKTPPPVDGSEAWAERLAVLSRSGTIAPTQDMRDMARLLAGAKAAKKLAEQQESTYRNQLLEMMGEADGIEGVATYRQAKGRAVTNWSAVCEAAGVPRAVVDQFTTRTPYRALRLLGGKDGE